MLEPSAIGLPCACPPMRERYGCFPACFACALAGQPACFACHESPCTACFFSALSQMPSSVKVSGILMPDLLVAWKDEETTS